MESDLNYRSNYFFSLVLAVSFHCVLLALVFMNIHFSHTKPRVQQQLITEPVKIVEAVTVDQKALEIEIAAIKQQQRVKQHKEENRVKRLNDQAEAAERKRLQAKKQLTQLQAKKKKEALQRQHQQQLAQKNLKDIETKKQQEQKQLADLKKKRITEQKHQEKTAAEKLLQQQLAAEEAQFRAAQEVQQKNEIAKYTALIQQAVGRHWRVPNNATSNLSCKFLIRLAPDGAVVSVKLLKGSGDVGLDNSAETAIYKASPLPVPKDPALFEIVREIRLLVRPEGYLTTTG